MVATLLLVVQAQQGAVVAENHLVGGNAALTKPGTSWSSSLSGSTERRGWRAQTLLGHPRWSWLSTRGTFEHQSSCGHPRPARGVSDDDESDGGDGGPWPWSWWAGAWWKLTCSGVTGFCDVLCSSSIVFWSKRKSFLHPTRMMGRPWQKCRTSEIHCGCMSVWGR